MSVLAGPNGTGKTTFINRFLRNLAEAFWFVNPNAASLSHWERALAPESRQAIRLARKGEGRTSPQTHDPHPFGQNASLTLCEPQALSQWERDGRCGFC